jgi:hypothetical protein
VIPAHQLPADADIRLPLVHSGLLIGEDVAARQPVSVNVLRELPTQVGVFGISPIVRLLAVRTLAFGARLSVLTHAPAAWGALRQLADGPSTVSIAPPRSQPPRSGSALAPSVVVDDAGVAPQGLRRDAGPWQTVLTVCPRPTEQALASLRLFDLLVLGRMPGPDAGALCAAYSLPGTIVRWLAELPADVVMLAAPNRLRFARLSPSPAERMLL